MLGLILIGGLWGTGYARSWDQNENVLAGQLGQVDLLLHVVDLDLDIGDRVSDLEWCGSGEGGESLVSSLNGGLQDGCWDC